MLRGRPKKGKGKGVICVLHEQAAGDRVEVAMVKELKEKGEGEGNKGEGEEGIGMLVVALLSLLLQWDEEIK